MKAASSKPRALPRFVALTPGDLKFGATEALVRAVRAGLPGILLREARWSDRQLLELAERLRACSESVWIGVHDRAHLIASEVVDGVHLGFRSLRPSEVREFAPEDKTIGFSAHAGDRGDSWYGADYVFFGPVNATPSKSGLVEPTGVAGLQSFCDECSLPVIALGGLRPEDVQACLEAGAWGVACLADLWSAADPGERVESWLAELPMEESKE